MVRRGCVRAYIACAQKSAHTHMHTHTMTDKERDHAHDGASLACSAYQQVGRRRAAQAARIIGDEPQGLLLLAAHTLDRHGDVRVVLLLALFSGVASPPRGGGFAGQMSCRVCSASSRKDPPPPMRAPPGERGKDRVAEQKERPRRTELIISDPPRRPSPGEREWRRSTRMQATRTRSRR